MGFNFLFDKIEPTGFGLKFNGIDRDGNANELRNKYSKTVGSISSNGLFYGLQFFVR